MGTRDTLGMQGIGYKEENGNPPPQRGQECTFPFARAKGKCRKTQVPARGNENPHKTTHERQPPDQPNHNHPISKAQSKAHRGASYAEAEKGKATGQKGRCCRAASASGSLGCLYGSQESWHAGAVQAGCAYSWDLTRFATERVPEQRLGFGCDHKQ